MNDEAQSLYNRLTNVNNDDSMNPLGDPASPYGLASPSSPERGSDVSQKGSSDVIFHM